MQDKTQQGITLTGRYQGSGRGFGFFIPEGGEGRKDDCFVPPRRDGGAWDGDTVEAVMEGEDPKAPGRYLARITKIIERGNQNVTGTIHKANREIWLRPDSDRLGEAIKVLGKAKVKEGEKAAVKVRSYGSPHTSPTGTLCATFGPAGSRSASTEAILFQQDIHREFPDEVALEAQKAPQEVEEAARKGRLDLRDKLIITIDGAASKDLDDAVSLEHDGDNWVLGVHIADVSHYVTPGSALDEEAFARGTSVYFADQVVPMLPIALSNGICSLNEGVDRLAISCFMTLDQEGNILSHQVAESVIRSTHRMTYSDCNALLAGTDPALEARYADMLPMLREMWTLSKALEKKRRNRGSLDLDTQESYILCDNEGNPVEILARRQGESEKLIESFMLCANETVAKHLFDAKFPGVYRVHEKPSMDKTENLKAMLAPLGYSLKIADGHSLQKVLDAAKGKPEAPAVSMMVLRSMMKARYDVENLGHFGIGADYYCHFTSPIRRYPDLMVHRCLHALLTKTGGKRLGRDCEKAASQSSQREIAAQTAERDIDKLYFAQFMHSHIGETFPATVSGVTRFGLFAALPNGVEGLIPVETLPEDEYAYDEIRMTLTGERTGTVYTFGMELEVVCVAADEGTGRVEFQLAGRADVPGCEGAWAGGRADAGPRSGLKTSPSRREGSRVTTPARSSTARGSKKAPSKRRSNKPAMHVPKQKKKGKGR